MLLLTTSLKARGSGNVLEIATKRFPFQGVDLKGVFLLPNFHPHFVAETDIVAEVLKKSIDRNCSIDCHPI